MIPFTADLLPLAPTATSKDQLAILSRIKNGLIGKRERKLELLRKGEISSIVKLVKPSRLAGEDELSISVQATAILGALSLPTAEAMTILLSSRAHIAMIDALTTLGYDEDFGGLDAHAQLRGKLLETLLRSIKTLYVDLVKVIGPRDWGCSVVGASVSLEERQDVNPPWEAELRSAAKGKGKESADPYQVNMDEDRIGRVQDLRKLGQHALDLIYTERSSVPHSDSSPFSHVTGQPPTLKLLIRLLVECSTPRVASWETSSPITSESTRLQIADMICNFFSGTVRLPSQRDAVLLEPESVAEALFNLIEYGSGKVQETALNALSALARGSYALIHAANRVGSESRSLANVVADLTLSSKPTLRLAAATCQTVRFKEYPSPKPDVVSTVAEPLIPILLALLEKEPTLRAQAAFTFAYLVADDEVLQDAAVKLKCLDILKTVLQAPPRVDQPYSTFASLEECARVQEGALLAVAVIGAISEPHRHQVLGSGLLPIVVTSLSHQFVGVRAAACHVLRGLARSVNVLRTTLLEAGAAEPLFNLLRSEEDLVVQITAAAAVSNLVVEFSPMRESLLEQGCMQRLCELAHLGDETLRINALFAIKNAVYQSAATFKRKTMMNLGWNFLAECISHPNEEISVEALAILRNITCIVNDDAVTGISELGEDRLFNLLEDKLRSESTNVILQAVYTLVNLATADEMAKLAIVSRNQIVRSLMMHMDHSMSEVRVGTAWVMINLCYQERSSIYRHQRKPHEIVSRLRALGVEQRLRTMLSDVSLDVRERVGQALELMSP
ncbi:ARM repeat-containing protein [Meredithblackwellia eburnea MCA 4105]